jgi:hypothetical protein
MVDTLLRAPFLVVIAGLDPAIHSFALAIIGDVAEWMPGSGPGMTTSGGSVGAVSGA